VRRRAQALPCAAHPPLPVGQRVTGAPFPARAGNGTWQQYIVVEEGALLAVPDKVSDEAAAQFLVRPGGRLQTCAGVGAGA
jgi:NADPH:quinone reductase-like Zn-dependent oxidoreductase